MFAFSSLYIEKTSLHLFFILGKVVVLSEMLSILIYWVDAYLSLLLITQSYVKIYIQTFARARR